MIQDADDGRPAGGTLTLGLAVATILALLATASLSIDYGLACL